MLRRERTKPKAREAEEEEWSVLHSCLRAVLAKKSLLSFIRGKNGKATSLTKLYGTEHPDETFLLLKKLSRQTAAMHVPQTRGSGGNTAKDRMAVSPVLKPTFTPINMMASCHGSFPTCLLESRLTPLGHFTHKSSTIY